MDKNEIIVFGEKINASSAQRGFFVAHKFTSDALNQAKRFPRIKLLHVRELLTEELLSIVASMHGIWDRDHPFEAEFEKVVPSTTESRKLNPRSLIVCAAWSDPQTSI